MKRSGFQGAKINPTKFHRSQIKFYLLLTPISLFMVLPVVFIVSQAFKPIDELFRFPPTVIVERPTFENFRQIMAMTGAADIPISRFIVNTLIVTTVTVVLTILITAMTAYCFSKKKFRLNKTLFKINQAALMFVPTAVMMPRFLVIVNTGIHNNFMAHILPLMAMPVGLFLVKSFVDTHVPDSLIEAARIDGAGEIRIMWNVVFPLITPALATVCVLTFQAVWGNIETSTLFVTNETMRTFAFYMHQFQVSATANPMMAGVGSAAALLMFFPNLIIFIAMQSRVMNTMGHSGIK